MVYVCHVSCCVYAASASQTAFRIHDGNQSNDKITQPTPNPAMSGWFWPGFGLYHGCEQCFRLQFCIKRVSLAKQKFCPVSLCLAIGKLCLRLAFLVRIYKVVPA